MITIHELLLERDRVQELLQRSVAAAHQAQAQLIAVNAKLELLNELSKSKQDAEQLVEPSDG